MKQENPENHISLRVPVAEDAFALHELVKNSPPLDSNSLYCNLLHCTHFSSTSVAALASPPASSTAAPELVGFVSAYIPPQQSDTLFVWQVVVASSARGQGLGRRMLDALLQRSSCSAVRFMDTTITAENKASWALFRSWARARGCSYTRRIHFDRERHLGGRHDSEYLARIGPFAIAGEAAT